jgi:Ca2+-binding EF-hand superfamily protein
MNTPCTLPRPRAILPIACAAALSACAPYDILDRDPAYSTVGGAPIYSASAQFDRLDTNRDGFLSRAEVEPLGLAVGPNASTPETAAEAFRRMDANRDGFLSRAEVGTTLDAIPGGSFTAFDINRDGFLSTTEAMPHLQWLQNRMTPALSFNGLDTDRDGFLNRAEAGPLLAAPPPSGGYAAAPVYSFDRLDTNRDGFLSRAEAATLANPLTFDRYDANRDNFLSRAEAEMLFRNSVGGTSGNYGGGVVYGPR